MRLPALAIGCAALVLTTACNGRPTSSAHGLGTSRSGTSTSRPTPSPVPSTHAQAAAAIRAALNRQGSGVVKVKEYSGDYSADPTTYQVDCTAAKRAEITWTSHARAGMPAPPKMLVILNGHDFYSKTLNFSLKKHEKPWYRGTFPSSKATSSERRMEPPFLHKFSL